MINPQPFFTQRTTSDLWIMSAGVGANFAIMCFALVYLVYEYSASSITWPYIVAGLLVGYFIADFASGVVHWGMDTWFSERELGRAVAIAREHHTHPQHILGYGFLEYSALGSTPSALAIGPAVLLTSLLPVSTTTYVVMMIWLITATCLFFGTSFHNLAHRPPNRIIGWMQKLHLVIPRGDHWAHHHREQLVRYCVINGWANYVCDPLRIWRGLEWLIHAATGIQPRRDDLEWQHCYRHTGTLPSSYVSKDTPATLTNRAF